MISLEEEPTFPGNPSILTHAARPLPRAAPGAELPVRAGGARGAGRRTHSGVGACWAGSAGGRTGGIVARVALDRAGGGGVQVSRACEDTVGDGRAA